MRLEPDEARRRFATGRVAVLATLGPDGTPALVPIVFEVVGDRVVTAVDPKPKRSPNLARLRNIARDPRVSLLVQQYEDEWRLLWWARADGAARAVSVGGERDAVIASLAAKYPQYGSLDGSFGDVVIVEVGRWSGWSAS